MLTADCFVDCHAHVLPDTVSAPTSRRSGSRSSNRSTPWPASSFGTDQPPVWFPLERSLDALAGLELPAEDAAAVRHGNAARLFGLSV